MILTKKLPRSLQFLITEEVSNMYEDHTLENFKKYLKKELAYNTKKQDFHRGTLGEKIYKYQFDERQLKDIMLFMKKENLIDNRKTFINNLFIAIYNNIISNIE
jgi:hypothetical protein